MPMDSLAGLKVVELTRAIVGPCAGRILADNGATVVHVESEKGIDILRTTHPVKDNIPGINRAGYYSHYNASKYGIALDLNKLKAKELMKKLIMWSDVFIESNAPGVVRKFGFDYEEVKKIKPDIIMASTTQVGQEGPLAHFQAYGQQSAAMAGFYAITGYPDKGPVGPVGSYTDVVAPQFLICAILAAVDYHRRTGKGLYIDQSQLEAGIHFLAPMFLEYTVNKRLLELRGNRDPCAAPNNVYPCKGDDRWCAIAVFSEDEWKAFCQAIGAPPWTRDEKFASTINRKRNEDELDKLIEGWTINYTAEEVMHRLQAKGVAAGIVATGEDLHSDPQLRDRSHFKWLNHPEMGEVPYDNPPFRLSKTCCKVRRTAPCLGQDTYHVCKSILGLPDEEFVQLMQDGVFT